MNRFRAIFNGLLVLLAMFIQERAQANDHIFPPRPVAQAAINFDGKGFLINGQRVFIVSAGMEYARVPRELWADRLMRFKRAGFNCIEMYTFWNYHEPQSGEFDFSGNRDLDAYLKLAKSLGLFAIVRVGPYYCAEWDSGGYPIWLRSVPDLQVRTNNAAFEHYVTRFWDHLLPIVVNNQINRGGNVILVQLENEHPAAWGTDGLDMQYFQFLQSTALAAGLEVPYFFSGLHHDGDPAGSHPWSSSARENPWFSTEFWCDWYDKYGETAEEVRSKDWATWKIIAYGGNGYNYYMAHGGTDFDYFNNDEDAASYDYGAAVGQAGDLRPEYYKYKRAAWFARSFQNILETSDNATRAYAKAATNPAVAVTARKSAAGNILFLANSGKTATQTQLTLNGVAYPQSGSLTINPSEIIPVVTGYLIAYGVTLEVAPTRILGISHQGGSTTIVIYGPPNAPAELYFTVSADTGILAGGPALRLNGTNLTLHTTYPAEGAASFIFMTGANRPWFPLESANPPQIRVRILVVSDALADDTWFVEAGGQNYVVCGPQYVGAATVTNGCLQLDTEIPWHEAANNPVVAYGFREKPVPLTATTDTGAQPESVPLAEWQTKSGAAPAASEFETSGWLASESGPPQMGADGDTSNCAWYRTSLNATTAGTFSIFLGAVADHMTPFIDGIAVPATNVSGNTFTTSLKAGKHTLAIFTTHYGRNKLVGYIGPISQMYVKGLSGPAYLLGGTLIGPAPVSGWQVLATNSSALGTQPPAPTDPRWHGYTVGADAFNKQPGFAWFQTQALPFAPAGGAEIANFSSVDDNCWVYLNGTLIASNSGWNIPFNVDLTKAWSTNATNTLSLLVQNTDNTGGLDSPVMVTACSVATRMDSWKERGGLGDFTAATDWQPLTAGATFSGPQFFKTTFTALPFGSMGPDPMWRVTTSGLSHGSVWVNGHNLGRYPETVNAPGLYIPECWLNKGPNGNTLEIFDEGGNLPAEVRLNSESAASRTVVPFRSAPGLAL